MSSFYLEYNEQMITKMADPWSDPLLYSLRHRRTNLVGHIPSQTTRYQAFETPTANIAELPE